MSMPPTRSTVRSMQHIKHFLEDVWGDLKQVNYSALIPTPSSLSEDPLQNRAVQGVILLGLAPLIFFQATSLFQLDGVQIIWLIQGYFCLLWGLYFHHLIKPSARLERKAIAYAAFTVTVGIPLLYVAQRYYPTLFYEWRLNENLLAKGASYIVGVGIPEEICKVLPLLFFGVRHGHIRNTRDGMFLGFASGLGFAISEGVLYNINITFAWGMPSNQILMYSLFRLLAGPVLHGAMAGIVGWFVAVAVTRSNHKKWPLITIGILFSGFLHGIYDTFSSNFAGLITALIIFLTFIVYLYYEPAEEVSNEMETIKILSD